MSRLIRYLRGSVRFRLTGAAPEQCLNSLAAARLEFWDIEREDALHLSLCVPAREAERLQRLALRCLCTAEVTERSGLRAQFGGLLRRPVLLLGLLAAHYLMQAYLTTRAEEWETARQNTLSYYHVVEGESGNSITYQPLIERYAAEYNLRPAFVAAIIRNESSFRTDAESSVGARGLMQLMPDTAEWIAGKIGDSNYSFDHLYDAETNIRYGCWYLNYLSKLFRGDAVLVSSAYHAGQTTVTRWLSDKGISSDGVTIPVDKLPDGPTKQYAGRVTTSYGIYEALLYPNESAEAAGAADGDIVSARAVRAGVANQLRTGHRHPEQQDDEPESPLPGRAGHAVHLRPDVRFAHHH